MPADAKEAAALPTELKKDLEGPAVPTAADAADSDLAAALGVDTEPVPAPTAPEPHVVIARDGLKLRAGPGLNFGTVRTLPLGTRVMVTAREGQWAQVDLQGDGGVDGYMFRGFLRPAAAAAGGPAAAPSATGDPLAAFTPHAVKSMFPATPLANIINNLPHVLAGLRKLGLAEPRMALMALATIRAETEGFVPISEFKSRFNTARTPFDLYDAGTNIGRRLGNTRKGDGPAFRGRGYVQLTGRDNYTRIGKQIDIDLVGNPELANDAPTAGLILAQFLRNCEKPLRAALAANDLFKARRLVNGGSHGFVPFKDAFERGRALL